MCKKRKQHTESKPKKKKNYTAHTYKVRVQRETNPRSRQLTGRACRAACAVCVGKPIRPPHRSEWGETDWLFPVLQTALATVVTSHSACAMPQLSHRPLLKYGYYVGPARPYPTQPPRVLCLAVGLRFPQISAPQLFLGAGGGDQAPSFFLGGVRPVPMPRRQKPICGAWGCFGLRELEAQPAPAS